MIGEFGIQIGNVIYCSHICKIVIFNIIQMDFFSTSRSSSNFIQHKTDDGSLDYSADWDTFSFESELNMRKNILEEDLKAYNNLLDQLYNDSIDIGEDIISEIENKKESIDELLETNEDNVSNCNSLLEEHKRIKENLEKLIAKKDSLQITINSLQEEETASRNSYRQLKLALQKAREVYTTYFNIKVSTKPVSDTIYEASLHFKEKDDIAPIKFTVDRIKRKVLDFQPNGVLLPNEEEEITKEFIDLKNLPGLFCALHDIILKK